MGGGSLRTSHSAGFTLAEVLITLGIIGIVAALTIPTLVRNYKKSEIETKLKRFYSYMNQAIQLAEIDYGDKITWDIGSKSSLADCKTNQYSEACLTAFFNKYLKNYLKYDKVKYDTDGPVIETGHKLLVYMSDGSVVAIGYAGSDYDYCMNYEAYKLRENGRGCFGFAFYPKGAAGVRGDYYKNRGLLPYAPHNWDGTKEDMYNKGLYSMIIQSNNWKIPDDYPVKL